MTPDRYDIIMTNHQTERTLLIDADDTLWENNVFYLRSRALFGQYMASLGCDAQAAIEALYQMEHETIPIYGYGPQGYIEALRLTCRKCLTEIGRRASPEDLERAATCGRLALDPPMILLPRVRETLQRLRPSSRLVLLTKGDESVQQRKIACSGLEPLFDHLRVVAEKDEQTYAEIVRELELEPSNTWMVGNSPRSDVNPATAIGLRAILIPHDHTWIVENQEIERQELVTILSSFADLLPHFGLSPYKEV